MCPTRDVSALPLVLGGLVDSVAVDGLVAPDDPVDAPEVLPSSSGPMASGGGLKHAVATHMSAKLRIDGTLLISERTPRPLRCDREIRRNSGRLK